MTQISAKIRNWFQSWGRYRVRSVSNADLDEIAYLLTISFFPDEDSEDRKRSTGTTVREFIGEGQLFLLTEDTHETRIVAVIQGTGYDENGGKCTVHKTMRKHYRRIQ